MEDCIDWVKVGSKGRDESNLNVPVPLQPVHSLV